MQRRATEIVAANVTSLMEENDITADTLAEATGIPFDTLRERLDETSPFRFGEVVDVSGFFHVPLSSLLEEVAG